MRDAKEKKRLDLRQAHLKGMAPSLWRMFELLHPEYNWRSSNSNRWTDRLFFDEFHNRQYEWLQKVTGLPFAEHVGWCHTKKSDRMVIEKRRRAQVKVAMRKINAGDYDTDVPTFRSSVKWEYC